MMRLAGKLGLVTAAGSGMGRAGALRFASEGAAVAVVDLNAEKAEAVATEIEQSGGRAIALSGDLGDDAFARRIVGESVDAFGGLDFVWNHVGYPGPAAVEGLDWDDYAKAMDLNVRTVLVTTEAAIPHMRARGAGSVLFTSSSAGLQGSHYSPVYSAAKFSVIGLSRALAKRYAREGIRFNTICPGTVDTPMLRTFVARPDSDVKGTAEEIEEVVARRAAANPSGRAARPEEIASAALFFLSDEAAFITGATLPVDGGATA